MSGREARGSRGRTGPDQPRSLAYLAPSRIDGQGVFAGAAISKGIRALECGGRLLCRDQVTDDMRVMQVGPDVYLAEDPDNPRIDDFLNHSCEPNVGFVDGSLTLYALRDIASGEEIVFDYSTCMNERGWWIACGCGTATCRGRVASFGDLQPEDQARLSAISLAYLRRLPAGQALDSPAATANAKRASGIVKRGRGHLHCSSPGAESG